MDTQVSCPSVSMVVNAFGNPPGQVMSRNGPYEFTSETNSNGVQYVTYSGGYSGGRYSINSR